MGFYFQIRKEKERGKTKVFFSRHNEFLFLNQKGKRKGRKKRFF
jgi:hypothetical protein